VLITEGDETVRPPLLALAAAGTIAFSLAAAGCGGSSGAKVAQVASAPTTTESSSDDDSGSQQANPAAFSACMRKNGVPDFPDPDSQGRIRITGGQRNGQRFGVDAGSAQFQKARKACQKLAPKGGNLSPQQRQEMQQAMLRFAQCMRSHGVPKFPDPNFQSGDGVTLMFGKNSGINPNSPAFQAAQKACQDLIPGRPGPPSAS
jgi:hypothetical protein